MNVRRFVVLFGILGANIMAQPLNLKDHVPSLQPDAGERKQGFWNGVIVARPCVDAHPDRLKAVEQDFFSSTHSVPAHPEYQVIKLRDPQKTVDTIKRLRDTGLFEHVWPLPVGNNEFYIAPEDQWNLARISAPAAWREVKDAANVIVAVIDSGVYLTHPDFEKCFWEKPKSPGVHGINAVTGTDDPSAGHPHGTEVAGVIGANGTNTFGISGVARRTQLMPLRFTTTGESGPLLAAEKCFQYAANNGALIINYSYLFENSDDDMRISKSIACAKDPVSQRVAVVVLPAGNDDLPLEQWPRFPVSTTHPLENIIVVASSDNRDFLEVNSNYSCGLVDLAAPGVDICSTYSSPELPYVKDSRGTSIAAPHVSGALALLRAKFPNDDHRALINRILRNVDQFDQLKGKVQTHGRLNVANALSGGDCDRDRRPFNDDLLERAFLIQPTRKHTGILLPLHVRSSNRYATPEPGEKLKEVATDVTGTLWWSWSLPEIATKPGKVTVDTEGTQFSAVLGVYSYSKSDPTMGDLMLEQAHDGASEQGVAKVEFTASPGKSYAICVGSHAGATPGYVSLQIAVQ